MRGESPRPARMSAALNTLKSVISFAKGGGRIVLLIKGASAPNDYFKTSDKKVLYSDFWILIHSLSPIVKQLSLLWESRTKRKLLKTGLFSQAHKTDNDEKSATYMVPSPK